MFRVLRNKKGMSLLEAVVSVAIFGVIAVPLIMLFSNSVILANKTRDKIDVNAVTEVVIEEVRDAMKNDSKLPKYGNYNESVNAYTDLDVSLEALVDASKASGELEETPELGIIGTGPDEYRVFSYKVEYNHNNYDEEYPDTYNFDITVFDKGKDGERVKKVCSIAVWCDEKE